MHDVQIIVRTHDDFTARCVCGWTPDVRRKYRTRQMVEDEISKHNALVARAQAALHGRNPSLKSQHAYYEEMANNPDVNEADRKWWRVLADGLAARLGKPVTEEEQEPLFLLESEK